MKIIKWSLSLMALCSVLLYGCVMGPDGTKHVSPQALITTEAMACAGAQYEATKHPEQAPKILAARDLLTVMLSQSNISPAKVNLALAQITSADTRLWLTPAVSLLMSYASDYASGSEILTALRNGLDCAVTSAPVTSLNASKAVRKISVIVYYDADKGGWTWLRLNANHLPIASWGKVSAWDSSAMRSAKNQNPGVIPTFYR